VWCHIPSYLEYELHSHVFSASMIQCSFFCRSLIVVCRLREVSLLLVTVLFVTSVEQAFVRFMNYRPTPSYYGEPG
jgi:hypothetical protein